MEGITPAPSPFHPTCLFLSFVIIFVILKIFKAGCFISLGVVISLFDRDCFNFLEFMDWKFITTFFHPLNDLTFTWLYILTNPFLLSFNNWQWYHKEIKTFCIVNILYELMFHLMSTFRNLLEIMTQTPLSTITSEGHLKQDSSNYILKTSTQQGINVSKLRYMDVKTMLVSELMCGSMYACWIWLPHLMLLKELLIKIWTADSTFDFL